MWVKICGITKADDALAAKACGADAIGIVLTKSTRRVDVMDARQWVIGIDGIEKVGVFNGESAEEIMETARMLKLDTVQLHGRLCSDHLELLGEFNIIAEEYRKFPGNRGYTYRMIVDPSRGSGTRGTWDKRPYPFILAGGLDPSNVAEAIRKACPVGVDTSSGVESSPGMKDHEKIRRFISEAKS